MNAGATKRLMKEIQEMHNNPSDFYEIYPAPNTLGHFFATITAPEISHYVGGRFDLEIKCEDSYPFKPPIVNMITPILHPNIDIKGKICIDTLTHNWSPALNIVKVLL